MHTHAHTHAWEHAHTCIQLQTHTRKATVLYLGTYNVALAHNESGKGVKQGMNWFLDDGVDWSVYIYVIAKVSFIVNPLSTE